MKKISTKCAKCKSNCKKEGTFFTEGGQIFYFCAFCALLLDKLDCASRIYLFLQESFPENIKNLSISPINKIVLLARLKREKGISPWSKIN